MKKSFIAFLCLVLASMSLVGCGTQNPEQLYEQAIKKLEDTAVAVDGSHNMNKYIVQAISNETFTEPKNIIYMIGDGMGFNIVEATQIAYEKDLYEGTLAVNTLPVKASQSTYSATSEITDSAAGGTALSTGYKTANYVVGMDKEAKNPYQTVLELAAAKGKDTGVVVDKNITDATPADFTAHVQDRELEVEIAGQQLEKVADGTLDVVFGGGSGYYERKANEEVFNQAVENGMTYGEEWADVENASIPVVGLFNKKELSPADDPSLAQMTNRAIELLSQNEEGFFLMVEGSQIDTAAHANQLDYETERMYDFDNAVAIAMRFVAMNPDTVLIITADHETGGLRIPQESTSDNIGEQHFYTSTGHTGINVPVYAAGYGTEELLEGYNENIDIAKFVAKLLGEENFGAERSQISTLMEEGMDITFSSDNKEYTVDMQKFTAEAMESENPRAIHFTVRNTSKKVASMPYVQFLYEGPDVRDGETYYGDCQDDYLAAGAEMDVTIFLPSVVWDETLSAITELKLMYEGTDEVTLSFSDFQITNRGLDN